MSESRALLGFLRDNIKSVWSLEHLLLMRRERMRAWTARELVAELRASDAIVQANLESLSRAGLIAPLGEGAFQFAPASADLEDCCAALAVLYQERPHIVRRAIMDSPERLQALADAFKIRREPE